MKRSVRQHSAAVRPRRWAYICCRAAIPVIGRRNLVRLLRSLLDEARLDVPNDMTFNGERHLQSGFVQAQHQSGQLTVFDVGAHLGHWSAPLIEQWRQGGRGSLVVHAFEPSAYTYERLSANLGQITADGITVHCHNFGLSNVAGKVDFFVPHLGAGANSVYPRADAVTAPLKESIELVTGDIFCAENGIERIDFLKCDAEGHDLAVLLGCEDLLSKSRIRVIQFEYNARWIDGRWYLRDAFDLLHKHGYMVGKLTASGVETYPKWEPELESFREGNYVGYLESADLNIATFPWWSAAP